MRGLVAGGDGALRRSLPGRKIRIAMANRWNIPAWLETEVRARDKACVYCRTTFTHPSPSRRSQLSWEHIVNDLKIVTRENIVLCCIGCNASKGQKPLAVWMESDYCKRYGITRNSVAPVVRQALAPSSLRARSGDVSSKRSDIA